MIALPEYVDGLPNLAGHEEDIAAAIAAAADREVFRPESRIDFASIKSAATIALHMHQPLIPAGGGDLRTARIISNLKYMMDNQGIGDNYNAGPFVWCYKRIGEFVPQLVHEGKEPRVMLEYSGTLLHGLRDMGEHHVIDALKGVTMNPDYRRCVEWLGCPWGHAVAPSTPIQDFRLHVRAFQHHFAAIFGMEAMERIRGFSPSEMAMPNHPDVAYAYIKTLVDCGFTWMLVQEHTVEQPENGHGPEQKHLPHRLVVHSSTGETAEIIALIKTQGSDTKLVAQMQPYYEAKSLDRWQLAGKSVPPLVSQIADGENGGVMMNEFPGKFMDCVREASHSQTPLMNGTEYLEHLFAAGITPADLPVVQPIFQKRIWDKMQPGDGPQKLATVIETCKKEDGRFNMDGGSWTNNISWVQGYENVLAPMDKASSDFYERVLKRPNLKTDETRYRNALYHLLSAETSCYRYWGQGIWTDYGAEMARRADAICTNDYSS
ncbi:polysaccharide deacetylase family protein [Defluviicoccus vanus]|uniref:Glycosyl hydrolase family 57 n=1 Tax=Defluviicoccus vanus TaxID=111831 RepID=A0A7H1MXV2_9PROT|nr:glycosyl hydrolase family 57 [Defluviicoccus vanus]QNT68288.1 glycosyl hydrolase family 57 [Defluviicoccus vanus]